VDEVGGNLQVHVTPWEGPEGVGVGVEGVLRLQLLLARFGLAPLNLPDYPPDGIVRAEGCGPDGVADFVKVFFGHETPMTGLCGVPAVLQESHLLSLGPVSLVIGKKGKRSVKGRP